MIRYSRHDHWLDVATVWQSLGYTEPQQNKMTKWLLNQVPKKRYVAWAHDSHTRVRLLVPWVDILATVMWIGRAPPFHAPNARKFAARIAKSVGAMAFPSSELATDVAERHQRFNRAEYQRILMA